MKKHIFNAKLFMLLLVPLIQLPSFQVIQVFQLNTYTVSFETYDGLEIESISGKFGTVIELPTPDKDDHRFFGWHLDGNFEQEVTDFFSIPPQNVTLYAKWKYSGLGSEFMPVQIQSIDDLQLLRDSTMDYFELTRDLVVDIDFLTIDSFSGNFNGNGYRLNIKNKPIFQTLETTAVIEELTIGFEQISNLSINATSGYAGMFAHNNKGLIDQVTIDYFDGTLNLSSSSSNVQFVGFVGLNEGTMSDIDLVESNLNVVRNTGFFTFGPLVGKNTGIIRNVVNESVDLVGTSLNLGGIVGLSSDDGMLENLTNYANHRLEGGIQDNAIAIGGVVSALESNATHLINEGSIELYSTVSYIYAGGIAGYVNTEDTPLLLNHAQNYGKVQAHNPNNFSNDFKETYIGGITAYASKNVTLNRVMNTGILSNQPKVGSSTRNAQSDIGGLVGINQGIVKESYNTGNINASDQANSDIGGLTGYTYLGKITTSYNLGSITSHNETGTSWIGGITGELGGSILEDVYNRGNITLTNNSTEYISVAAGLVGGVFTVENANANPTKIQRGYATGTISGPSNSFIGGILGKNYISDSIVSNTHYLKTSNILSGVNRNQNNVSTNTGTNAYTAISNMYSLANTLGNQWKNITNQLPRLKWQDV